MAFSLRLRLNLMSLLPIGFLVVITFAVFFGFSQHQMIDSEMDDLEIIATLKQQILINWFDERTEEVVYLANIIGAESGSGEVNLEAVYTHAPHFSESHAGFDILVVADTTGKVIYDSARRDGIPPEHASVAERPFFIQALAGKSVVDGTILSRTNDRFLVMAASPIRRGNTTVGVLFAPVSTQDALITITDIGSRFVGSANVLDRDNRLILGSNEEIPRGFLFPEDRFPDDWQQSTTPDRHYKYQNEQGQWILGLRLPLRIDDWSIVVETPQAVALAESRRYMTILVSVGVVSLLIASLIASLISRGVLHPIQNLLELSRLVAKQEYRAAIVQSLPPKGPPEINRVVSAFQETVVALTHHMEQLEESTLTDYLTSLPNRRYFERELYRVLKLCRREGWVCTLMMLDLDHFKRVNDTYGHAFGDRVLKEFSRRLTTTLRTTDLAARIGGEEFAVLCPNTETESAREIALRISEATRANPIQIAGPSSDETQQTIEHRITISIGVVVIPANAIQEDRMDAFLDQADRALYTSKSNGRDRVTLSTE